MDGHRVATACKDGTARVWNAHTADPVTPAISHGARLASVAFSPDGTLIVTASSDHSARIWDAATGEAVTPPLRHDGPLAYATFSPDGRQLATASDDGTARIWNLGGRDFGVEDLELFSQLLSARRLDQTGSGLQPIDVATLSNAWHTLRSKYGPSLGWTKEAGDKE